MTFWFQPSHPPCMLSHCPPYPILVPLLFSLWYHLQELQQYSTKDRNDRFSPAVISIRPGIRPNIIDCQRGIMIWHKEMWDNAKVWRKAFHKLRKPYGLSRPVNGDRIILECFWSIVDQSWDHWKRASSCSIICTGIGEDVFADLGRKGDESTHDALVGFAYDGCLVSVVSTLWYGSYHTRVYRPSLKRLDRAMPSHVLAKRWQIYW